MSPQKIALENLKKQMQVFLDFPQVEESLQAEIEDTVKQIMLSKAQNGGRPPLDVMMDYLDAGKDSENRLKFIIGLSGGSLEKMKRVYAAIFSNEAISAIKNDANIRRTIATFLINPRETEIFIPSFVRDSFFLPNSWIQLLQDEEYLHSVARNMMQSKYAVRMGIALEEYFRDAVAECGGASQKGAVTIVDKKEVDIAIPTLEAPRILIMSSYQLTTSSAQSSKANEQARMYQLVQTHNESRQQRDYPDTLFVNVVDGGGWLSRSRDLESLWRKCDYCFSYAGLDDFKTMLSYYLQES